jgi:hypothetical protein
VTPSLRRVPGTDLDQGMFMASGSLRGLEPGRREVLDLTVGRGAETLEPLAAFKDLRWLCLERVEDVNLLPLTGLTLESLECRDLTGVDLGPLAAMTTLRSVSLTGLHDCPVPGRLVLPGSLERLEIGSLGGDAGNIAELVRAIEWPVLENVRILSLTGTPDAYVDADLSLVRYLPRLESVLVRSVRHRGAAPSPLEPPFEGLSAALRWISFEPVDREAALAVLRVRFPGAELKIGQWVEEDETVEPWTVRAPTSDVPEWATYGSIADLPAFHDYEEEYEAMQAARKLIRAADPALARRLDFDPESNGTGISAPTHRDLLKALEIIGAR